MLHSTDEIRVAAEVVCDFNGVGVGVIVCKSVALDRLLHAVACHAVVHCLRSGCVVKGTPCCRGIAVELEVVNVGGASREGDIDVLLLVLNKIIK